MGKSFTSNAVRRIYSHASRSFAVASVAAIAFLYSVSPAHAFNSYHARISDTDTIADVQMKKVDDGHIQNDLTNSPTPSVADSCLPLLKSIHHISPPSATDRNQRSAGKAAALGLVIGVRFALSPAKKATPRPNARLTFWQPYGSIQGDRHALAVASYRDCQKEQALKALGDIEWEKR